MRKGSVSAVLISLLFVSGSLAAVPVGLTAKVGTLGLGLDLTCGLQEEWNLRIGVNGATYSMELDADVGDLNADLQMLTVPVLIDWHPGAGGFRLSGGLVFNGNEITLDADAGTVLEFNDTDYLLQDFQGDATFDPVALYLGLGWGNAVGDGGRWHFAADLGVMYQGSPDVSASAITATGNPSVQANLQRDLDVEIESINEDLDAFVLYPVLSLGVSYTF